MSCTKQPRFLVSIVQRFNRSKQNPEVAICFDRPTGPTYPNSPPVQEIAVTYSVSDISISKTLLTSYNNPHQFVKREKTKSFFLTLLRSTSYITSGLCVMPNTCSLQKWAYYQKLPAHIPTRHTLTQPNNTNQTKRTQKVNIGSLSNKLPKKNQLAIEIWNCTKSTLNINTNLNILLRTFCTMFEFGLVNYDSKCLHFHFCLCVRIITRAGDGWKLLGALCTQGYFYYIFSSRMKRKCERCTVHPVTSNMLRGGW